MYVCLECGNIFEEPEHSVETHGFPFPPYEHFYDSPCCGGNFAEAFKCDCCDEWITDSYVKVDDKRYCSECYRPMDLGDE